MPIAPENRHLYPADWDRIRRRVLDRAQRHCEGSPAYPDCEAKNGAPHPVTGSVVRLSIAHLNHDPSCNEPWNLRAWCERCHNTHDRPHRLETVRRRRALGDLFDGPYTA